MAVEDYNYLDPYVERRTPTASGETWSVSVPSSWLWGTRRGATQVTIQNQTRGNVRVASGQAAALTRYDALVGPYSERIITLTNPSITPACGLIWEGLPGSSGDTNQEVIVTLAWIPAGQSFAASSVGSSLGAPAIGASQIRGGSLSPTGELTITPSLVANPNFTRIIGAIVYNKTSIPIIVNRDSSTGQQLTEIPPMCSQAIMVGASAIYVSGRYIAPYSVGAQEPGIVQAAIYDTPVQVTSPIPFGYHDHPPSSGIQVPTTVTTLFPGSTPPVNQIFYTVPAGETHIIDHIHIAHTAVSGFAAQSAQVNIGIERGYNGQGALQTITTTLCSLPVANVLDRDVWDFYGKMIVSAPAANSNSLRADFIAGGGAGILTYHNIQCAVHAWRVPSI